MPPGLQPVVPDPVPYRDHRITVRPHAAPPGAPFDAPAYLVVVHTAMGAERGRRSAHGYADGFFKGRALVDRLLRSAPPGRTPPSHT